MALTQVMVVAGEASGDQHAAAVVAEIRKRIPEIRFFGMGGPALAAAGLERLFLASEISVMGVAEVVPKLHRILEVMRRLEKAARRRKPALALLVDVPDFNLRLAQRCKRLGIPVVYYVSPTVWAWRTSRVLQVADRVERMLCILPFEPDFYRRFGVAAEYVGNPVVEASPASAPPQHFRAALGLDPGRATVALLPGSRRSEVSRILPAMTRAAGLLSREKPDLQFVLPVAPGLDADECRRHVHVQPERLTLVPGRAAETVGASDVAIVASGTAVLEAALMERPLVAVYRVSPLSYAVGRLLVDVPHITLVNLLLGKRVVPELIQAEMTPEAIAREVRLLLSAGPARDQMLAALAQVRESLGPPGAAARAAEAVLSVLRARSPDHAMWGKP